MFDKSDLSPTNGIICLVQWRCMNKYLRLFRMGNVLIGSFAILIAAFMATGTAMVDYWQNLIVGFFVVFAFIAGGNSLNDYIDAEIDKTAHPDRPVPSGELTAIQARNVGIVMLLLSVLLSLITMDVYCIAIVVIACVLMFSYELFLKHDHFGEAEYRELCDYTHAKGMDFTSTPFDYASADYLEDMVDFYKISSSDLSNLPFIAHIARKGKPVFMSVGAAYLSECDEAIRVLKDNGCKDIVIFHCVLSYPTDPKNANLLIIDTLKKTFPDVRVGFSDHVAPDDTMMTLATAYLLGAEVIEKHFTLDKTLPGNDHYHGGDPEDFKKAIANFKWIDMVLGSPEKTVLDCEIIPRREARRSLVLTRDMKAGEVIKAEDLMPKRPGTGISPRFVDIVIGRKVNQDLAEDTILTWDMV